MVAYREPTITVASVEAALEGLKYTNKDVTAARSLHTLALVDASLKDPTAPASPLMRDYVLRQILSDLIIRRYQSYYASPVRETMTEAEAYGQILRDAQTNNADYIGWSILYHLYLVMAPSLTQELYAQHGPHSAKTVYRYKKTALEQLTLSLIQEEWQMRRQRVRQRLMMQLPPSDGISLVGRDDILQQIEITLARNPYPRIVFAGPPGCGKSALVREVARRLIEREKVDCLVWLDAPRNLADVDAQIHEHLRTARLKSSWEELTASYSVLAVLENSQSLAAHPSDWDEVLSGRLGRTMTLVAGRFQLASQRAGADFTLGDLEFEAVADLVRELLHVSSRDTTSYQSYAQTVWKAVGGNPAAIRLMVNMLEERDIPLVQKNVLTRVYDHFYPQLDEEVQRLWNLLVACPEDVTQAQLQMLGSTEAIATLLQHGILTHTRSGYTLSHSAWLYRGQYKAEAVKTLWAQIHADSQARWGWAAAYLLEARLEALPAENVTVLLKRYQHEMPLHPQRWRPALERWSSVLNSSLSLTYASCLFKLGDVNTSQQIVQDVIRQAGRQGDFVLQAEALLLHSAIGRHRGTYQEAMRDLQRVRGMAKLPEALHQRLIEEELHIALDREDREQMQSLLPHLTGTFPESALLRLEVSAFLGYWDACQRLADQIQREQPEEEAWVLTILGRNAHHSQQFAQAADYFQAALLRFEQRQDIRALSRTQMNLASSLLALDQREDAKTLLETAAQTLDAIQDQVGLSAVQANLDYLSQLNRFNPL